MMWFTFKTFHKQNKKHSQGVLFVLFMSMGYEKDIFSCFAHDFELSHLLVKSFAFAHGEIQNKFWMKYFAFRQNVKLNPPTRCSQRISHAVGVFHIAKQYFTHPQGWI